MFKTQKEIRAAFYASNPNAERRTQNDQPADIRTDFVDFVDYLHRAELISDALARRATL
jgi:hypothetical protein